MAVNDYKYCNLMASRRRASRSGLSLPNMYCAVHTHKLLFSCSRSKFWHPSH